MSRGVILIFAIACGVCVANVYFPQALSPLIATHLHATPAAAALLVTTTQLGYAAGLICRCRSRPEKEPHLRLLPDPEPEGGRAPDAFDRRCP